MPRKAAPKDQPKQDQPTPREQIANWTRDYVRGHAEFDIPTMTKKALGQFGDPAFLAELFKDQVYVVFYEIIRETIRSARGATLIGSGGVSATAVLSGHRPKSVFADIELRTEQLQAGHKRLLDMTAEDVREAISIRSGRILAEQYRIDELRPFLKTPKGKTIGEAYGVEKVVAMIKRAQSARDRKAAA